MGKYITQYATDYDGQSAAFKKATPFESLADTHYATPKYDGCCLIVQTRNDGPSVQFSRTNEPVLSCDHIGEAVLNALGPGWTVIGEAWTPGKDFHEISGNFRRHDPSPELQLRAFDIVHNGGWAVGAWDTAYRDRLDTLYRRLVGVPLVRPVEYFTPGSYGDSMKLAESFVAKGGYDGLMLWNPDGTWVRGSVRAGECVKVKPVMSLDLRVVGGKAEQKATKLGGVLVVSLGGELTQEVGSGVTQEIAQTLLSTEGNAYNGQIAEVEFLGFQASGLLREPRFKGFRTDKVTADR